MTETGITTQKQGKASDYKSVDCGNSGHCEGVLAAVGAFYRGRKQGKGKGHAHKRSGTEAARRKSKATHRHADGLSGTQISKPRPSGNTKTPKRFLVALIKTQASSYLPTGVKPL